MLQLDPHRTLKCAAVGPLKVRREPSIPRRKEKNVHSTPEEREGSQDTLRGWG